LRLEQIGHSAPHGFVLRQAAPAAVSQIGDMQGWNRKRSGVSMSGDSKCRMASTRSDGPPRHRQPPALDKAEELDELRRVDSRVKAPSWWSVT
jgi:hypothetical protein